MAVAFFPDRRILLPALCCLFLALHFAPVRSLSEAGVLLKLKNAFHDNNNALASWAPDTSPCEAKWAGIMCFNGIITGLHLTGMGLTGTVDINALTQIRGLRTISLVNNSFTGPMPEFNKLGVLKALLLTGNSFSGEIPADFFSHLNSLKKVWINENKFSGKLPDSLAQLSHLIELHLENNGFTGKIPDFKKAVASMDFSNNKLEGEIPAALATYKAAAFSGNDGLCGKPLPKVCGAVAAEAPARTGDRSSDDVTSAEKEKDSNNGKMISFCVIGTMVVILLYLLLSSWNKSEDDFSQLGSEHMANDVEEVDEPSTRRRAPAVPAAALPVDTSRKGDSRKGPSDSQHGKSGSITDLVMVNDEKGSFGMSDLMKAAAEVLGNGGLGSAYKAVMTTGISVAVKRMREMNRLGRDGFDAEMRRFGRLRHPNILTPLAYHYRREEKLLVSEYIPKGSLLYVLHGDRGSSHAELNWPTRLKIAKGIARGVGFLFQEFAVLELPHGNLKSSNVLLSDDHEPLLSDYAFLPLMSPSDAAHAMFAFRSPDRRVSPKSDVFCLGILLLELLTGKFPSHYLAAGKGGTDLVAWALSASGDGPEKQLELLDPDLLGEAGAEQGEEMLQLLHVGMACVEANSTQRPEMREAIARIEEVQAG